jgi:alkylation response protein AidB-like acyl-CoA dehydrogenase
MLNLEFPEDQRVLQDTFARLLALESTPARVRAAEPLGFDPALQRSLGELGAFGIRAPEAAGGSGAGLMDAALLMEEAGRHLASVPLAESIVAARLLAELGGPEAAPALERALFGEQVVTLALHETAPGAPQVVPGGAVADAVLALEGDEVFLIALRPRREPAPNHGSQPIASLVLSGNAADGERIRVARGPQAREAFLAGVEEWKVLTAAQLNGLSRRALEYAVEYAKERFQFGRPIGSFQAVAHPLADRAVDIDGAQLFTWWAIQQVATGTPEAAAAVAMSYWWSCRTADEAARRAIHTFGGYGVTLEYDLQLYFRRAKAWPLVLGDPADQLVEGARRLWLGASAPLPDAGDPGIDFNFGEEAEALAKEMCEKLERITTPEWRAKSHFSYAGYDPEVSRKLGEAGLVHPAWPVEWGGRGAHPFAASLALTKWTEFNVTNYGQASSHFVGSVIMHWGSEELKREVLPDIGRGLKNTSLGYTEPSGGSDVFGAKTRARWDEANQEWVINGQKMFTSGAEVNDYVFLLTRTNPESSKHAGVTMFLVPLDTPGVEYQAVHTMQDERTNATFYSDVRLPDRYRVGEVNGGAKLLSMALALEHGAGYAPGDHDLVDAAVEWARRPGADGRPRLEKEATLFRIARVKVDAWLRDLFGKRALYFGVTYPDRRTTFGPANKLFGSEAAQRDMADLIDLTAPESLFRGAEGVGKIELGHRTAQIGTIYGGTSEIHRSMIAEIGLGLPRSR